MEGVSLYQNNILTGRKRTIFKTNPPQRSEPSTMEGKLSRLAVLVVILAISMPGVQIAATFDHERVRIVDWCPKTSSSESSNDADEVDTPATTALLLRGNVPLNCYGRYDPDMLIRHIEANIVVPNHNHSRIKVDQLIVVSLLSRTHSDEKKILQAQQEFYLKQQQQASSVTHAILHRPIVGSWLVPPILSKIPFLNELIWNYIHPDDGAWELAQEIRSLLSINSTTVGEEATAREDDDDAVAAMLTTSETSATSASTSTTVVYVHCMRGIDRTGLVSGTYLARYGNIEGDIVSETTHASTIRNMNYEIKQRNINVPAQNALEWVFWRNQTYISENDLSHS